MRMLSGRMHWLTMGLALLVSAQEFTTRTSHGQAPSKPGSQASRRQAETTLASYAHAPSGMNMGGMPMGGMPMGGMPGGGMPGGGMPGGGMPGGGMMGPDGPMHMSFPGPAPMDMESMYAGGNSLGSGCDTAGGCPSCGNGMCGGYGCGPFAGRLGNGLGGVLGSGNGPMARMRGCACGGVGCMACSGNCGSLFGGHLLGLLGPLAPFTEGGAGAQRWFDFYAGTIGLARTSGFGGYSGPLDPITGVPQVSDVMSTDGVSGTPVLRTSDLDLDRMRYGLELIANLQVGAGTNIEARYFGLNNWETSRSVRLQTPDLFSVFSDFGTNPPGGFDDTDGSFVHTISYNSELHSGEVNFRRRWVSPVQSVQGSWLAGIRYFDLDERFGFAAEGPLNNTFTFNNKRFANIDTSTRNEMTGFQLGGDLWVTLMPGIMLGVEGKSGIYGNHAEVETQVFTNSIPAAREFLQDGKTAYLSEFTASAVYRLTYSWSVKTSYNLLYVDNVALAPENINTRDYSNGIGGGAFTGDRFPVLNTDGEALYQGWSIGGEYLY